jgi:uncharacterized protein YjaG (DUF416 family)
MKIKPLMLESLSQWQQIALGAAAVAKMVPNYALFCELTDFVDSSKYTAIVALVWEYATGNNSKIDFEKQQLKLDPLNPNPQQFDMYGVWPALDAVTALSSLLSACHKWDSEEIGAVLTLSDSTISAYLDLIEVGSEAQQHHPLFQLNEDYIDGALSVLTNGTSRTATIKALKTYCAGFEASNIGLSLAR